MPSYRNILVPLNGSNFGEHALSLALAAARLSGAQLHLVHVVGSLLPAIANSEATAETLNVARIERERDAAIGGYLAAVNARVQAAANVSVATAMLNGNPADAILEYAGANDVDFVAMATHGRGGMSRSWLGSVAEAVVRKTNLPVLLTRPSDDFPAALDSTTRIARVLAPLQDSEFSAHIMPHVQSLAAIFGSEVTLMEVVIPVEVEAQVMTPPVLDKEQTHLAEAMRKAEGFLEARAAPLRDIGIPVSLIAVSAPHAAAAILAIAEERNCNVIAMATHARHGVARLLFGSVADKVVRGTTRSVLLWRPVK